MSSTKTKTSLLTTGFDSIEKKKINDARKTIGQLMPRFYHDAIVAYANQILGDENA